MQRKTLTEVEYTESKGLSSTTSKTWITKAKFNFDLDKSDVVVFKQTGCVYVNTNGRQVLTRLILDKNIVINDTSCVLSSSDRQIIDSISSRYNLNKGSHSLELQFCRGILPTTVYIENASISVINGG